MLPAVHLPSRHDSTPIDFSSDVSFCWSHQGKIALISIRSVSRESVDLFVAVNLTLMGALAPGEPFLSMQDCAYENFSVSPYIRSAVNLLDERARAENLTGRMAILLLRSPLTTVIRLVANQQGKRYPNLPRRMFFSRQDGLAWLAEQLARR